MESRTVAGRYRLLRPLGSGGMGTVWRAHDDLLQRDAAIKEIRLPLAGQDDPAVKRALREAQAAARLQHPGIVTVHDVVIEDHRPWIVMELVDGGSLAAAIREAGLLSERRTAEVGLAVLDALHAAHRGGITHRDVKPANILLDDDRPVGAGGDALCGGDRGVAVPPGLRARHDGRDPHRQAGARRHPPDDGHGSWGWLRPLWDTATGRPVKIRTQSRDTVLDLAFSPDGRTIAVGGDDHLVRLAAAADFTG